MLVLTFRLPGGGTLALEGCTYNLPPLYIKHLSHPFFLTLKDASALTLPPCYAYEAKAY